MRKADAMNEISGVPQLLPETSFRGGEYVPMWSDTNCRLYRLQNRFLMYELPQKLPRVVDVSLSVKGAYMVAETVVVNGFVYALCYRYEGTVIIRYDLKDWKLPGVRIQLLGQPFAEYGNQLMTSDGTYFYFTHKNGHLTRKDHVISKYELTEKGLVYSKDIICGEKTCIFDHITVTADGSIYAFKWNGTIYKFNPDGSENYVYEPLFNSRGIHRMIVIKGNVYISHAHGTHYRLITLE